MIKKISVALFILCLLSCQSKATKAEISQLKQEAKNQKILIDSLQNFNQGLIGFQDYFKNERENYYLDKDKLLFLLEGTSWFSLNNKKLLRYFFDDFNLKEYDVFRGIENSSVLYPSSDDVLDIFNSESSFVIHMVSKIDRSPAALEKLCTPELKEMTYSLLKENDLYKASGAYAGVKALLLSYEDVENDKEFLATIHKIATNATNDYEEGNKAFKNAISAKTSDEIRAVLSDENYTTYYENTRSNQDSRLIEVYCFWARRHKEGNMEFTYTFLKELHENVANEFVTTDAYSSIDGPNS
ncbi:hypothetical protein Celal_0170 [Cellulophaga algicola DSM 14237]|uniref:Lipoprotein n=1 Tax=Cellulophaga algicola (strain DSM 14237 / IC166 / ACAM 630) TaxID=688270 RepID=E6X7S8_CELAD|nr:hypothetical protein [Cellulophaga algicola]ADV47521.1 hypothetical protein Celal_0170 [Cellulophaga algicola DSM 14237]